MELAVGAHCWSHVSRAWHPLGPGYMRRFGGERSHTVSVSPPAASPTAVVTGPQDPADDPTLVRLGKDQGTWLATGGAHHDAGSP